MLLTTVPVEILAIESHDNFGLPLLSSKPSAYKMNDLKLRSVPQRCLRPVSTRDDGAVILNRDAIRLEL